MSLTIEPFLGIVQPDLLKVGLWNQQSQDVLGGTLQNLCDVEEALSQLIDDTTMLRRNTSL